MLDLLTKTGCKKRLRKPGGCLLPDFG